MPKQPQQDPKQWADLETAEVMDRAFFIAEILENITLPFLRIGPGVDQPGFSWLFTFAGIFLWGLQARSSLVIKYWYLWIAASVIYRLSSTRKENSYFLGYPWFVQMIVKGERAACLAEALAVIGFGYMLPDFGLRWLLMVSGGASLINELVFRYTQERKKIEIANAQHQMAQHQKLFKRD